MIKNSKNIGVVRLDIITFFIMFIFSLLGYKIYYLTISNTFQNIKLIKFLEKINFFWLSYENFEQKNIIRNKDLSRKISFRISKKISQKVWSADIEKKIKKKIFLNLCIYERLNKQINLINELILQLKNISKSNKLIVWDHSYEFIDLYLKKNLRITNLCPSFFFYIIDCFYILIKFLLLLFNQSKKFLIFQKETKKSHKLHYDKYNYILFPKGIVEGEPKDYFFSNNKNSLINNNNLLIIELENKEIEGKHKQYMESKKLKFCLWQHINFSIKFRKLKELLQIYMKVFYHTKNIYISNLIFKILFLNEKNISNFRRLSKVKYMLVGHEELIPYNIKVSALINGIKIIANQTRSKLSLSFAPLLINYYFTFSKQLGKLSERNFQLKDALFLPVGNYKNKEIYRDKNIKNKTKIKNNYKFLCTVWDYPSKKNWYSNGREIIGNYKRNKVLLDEVLILANSFPHIKFLIKSKNLDYMKIRNLKNICIKLKKIKNIEFTSFSFLKAIHLSDFGYGNYTSAMDQMIYQNKPIVIRNYYNNFNDKIYSKEMISYNYNDSYNKILYILNNFSKVKKKQLKIKNAIFDSKDKKIFSEIKKIIDV